MGPSDRDRPEGSVGRCRGDPSLGAGHSWETQLDSNDGTQSTTKDGNEVDGRWQTDRTNGNNASRNRTLDGATPNHNSWHAIHPWCADETGDAPLASDLSENAKLVAGTPNPVCATTSSAQITHANFCLAP
eukprot:scaffold2126_cov303-Pavlova_lutheri.AAC.3